MESDPESGLEEALGGSPVRELRRSYHDRIADLRTASISIVSGVVSALRIASGVLLEDDTAAEQAVGELASAAEDEIGGIDSEVLALLALQSPVASDLRMVLVARDIAQVAGLCVGLCRTLVVRGEMVRDALPVDLRPTVREIGDRTVALLAQANAAWTALDVEQAMAASAAAAECRVPQRVFLARLFGLRALPVDVAVDLGLVARAYERLTDHALEIAGRVEFAVCGPPQAQPNRPVM